MENFDELKKKFPLVYSKKNYAECGDGWYQILHDIGQFITFKLEDMSNYIFIVAQIKEKFGGLRFYYHAEGLDDRTLGQIDGFLSYAEWQAERTCENCGKPGVIIKKIWLKCLCEDCNK